MDTAVFSVVYPGIENYISDYLVSLSNQTDSNFALYLLNDGLQNIERYLTKVNLDIKIENASAPPATLRKLGISWVKEGGAKFIIFADADDCLAENRVEISKEILDKYDLVFNELILTGPGFTDATTMLGTHFSDGEIITYKRIRTANCMGLTNTALRIINIPRYVEQIPEYVIAFDWALFALCLHNGAKGVFTNKTASHYRQHGNNLAALYSFEEEQILLGVQVKRDHYDLLVRFYKEYVPLANQFGELLARLKSDDLLRQRYCQAVRQQSPSVPLWWESIKSLEELGI